MELLREAKIRPTSMIDISDGLGSDLLHLCRSSKTGATIYEDKLVIDPQVVLVAEQFGISPLAMALEGGEDYELLFTVPLEYFENLKARQEVHIIGHMVEEDAGVNIVTSAGSMIEINEKGWNHFKGKT
jgi:thiamine-monophosphate kinase